LFGKRVNLKECHDFAGAFALGLIWDLTFSCKSTGYYLIISVASYDFLYSIYIFLLNDKMLRYEPNKRITTGQALEHEYFKDLETAQ
jgi:serine/threonine protein kinase